jgi:hypothetical protein
MVEWFLLDRINGQSDQFGVIISEQLTTAIKATSTDAGLAIAQTAIRRTEVADHSRLIDLMIIGCGLDHEG